MHIKVCRICLDTERKLYEMNRNNLHMMYQQLTGTINGEEKLPHKLCWECTHRLIKFSKFRSKALHSQGLMMEILLNKHYLSTESVRAVDRIKNGLSTSLISKSIDVNYNDLHLYDTSLLLPHEIKLEIDLIAKDVEEINDNVDLNNDKFVENNDDFDGNNDKLVEINDDGNESTLSTSSSDIVLAKQKKKLNKLDKKLKNTLKEDDIPKVDRRRKPASEVLNKDIFMITDLNLEEQIMEIEKRRDSSNYTRSEYQCKDCFKGFLDEDAFNHHIIRHTEQSGAYVCEICKVRFKKPNALRNHATSHTQKFSCKQCPYVTTRRHAAKLHEEYHNGTRYQCPHCREDFCKVSTYMSHIRIKHPSDFVCALCGHSFVSSKGLGLHKKLKHRFDEQTVPADGPYCEQCEVRFISEEAFEKHMKLSARHNNDLEVKEKGSRKRVKQQSTEEKKESGQKKKSKYSDKPEGPLSCEQCNMQLPDSISYYRHFRRAHPDKNRTNFPSMKSKCMCEVCGKMFQSRALLRDHSFTHTDSKQFQCAQCSKSFQRKYRLIAHMRLHAGRRPAHACPACGKRLATASNMQRHMVSHTGLKPFKCEMCGKCFKHASEKRVHITYVHLKKPWPKRSRGKRRTDSRQTQQPVAVPDSVSLQPAWPACSDPKIPFSDKPIYYNLKI